MKEEIKLLIQNQMITNRLLSLLVASAHSKNNGEITLMVANKLDEITDDMVEAANVLSHINK